jgi:carbonic anhydrase
MKRIIKMAVLTLTVSAFTACTQEEASNTNEAPVAQTETIIGLVEEVLTQEQRDALSPDDVLKLFKDGNERFINNDLTARNHSAQVRASASGQFPKAVVLSCLDSRVPVEDVFDRGIGDVFVGRVAGNFVNEDLLGSMEFGCKVAGSKLILVLGHEHCGAVKAAIDNVKLGNITTMLSKILPAVEQVIYEGVRNSNNAEFVQMVCESNIHHTISQIRANSPILKELEDNGQIKIVGAVYDMDSGIVTFLE